MIQTKIISAFPACGKTWVYEHQSELGISVLDCDSGKFNWIKEEVTRVPSKRSKNGEIIFNIPDRRRNPDFPRNYIEHIQENIGKYDYILVSSHEEVRNALREADIDYLLVFPDKNLKAEWIGRCYLRGSGAAFCDMIADKWDEWLDDIKDGEQYFVLEHGDNLEDVIIFLEEEE